MLDMEAEYRTIQENPVTARWMLQAPASEWTEALGMKRPPKWQVWRRREWEMRVHEAKRIIRDALRGVGRD